MPRPSIDPKSRTVTKSVRLRPDQWATLERIAKERGCSVAQCVREAAKAWLGDDWPG
jgi:predicted DNA-binding ribbon-helix-helix protein